MNAYDATGRLKLLTTVVLDNPTIDLDSRYAFKILGGAGDPTANPDVLTERQLYYNETSRAMFIWNVTNQAWDEFIS